MGYGIISESAREIFLAATNTAGYGTIDTRTSAMTSLPYGDVSIHTSLSMADVTRADGSVHHSIGVISWVDGGNPGGDATPGRWASFVYLSNCTSYVAGVRVDIHGGYVRGHHFVSFWGDPSSADIAKPEPKEVGTQAVYDADTGQVLHVHTTYDLGGGQRDEPVDLLSLARRMGRGGNIQVADVEDASQVAGSAARVDLDTMEVRAL